ncbi:hypothetical protein AAE478_003881 [Parahypoxylon ruwenzoriense]
MNLNNTPAFLPAPPTLHGVENLEDWRSCILDHLRMHKLHRFVLEHVPAPPKDSFERGIYEQNRLHAKILLSQTLGPAVKKTLRYHGWDQEKEHDPKAIWDLVLAKVPAVSDDRMEDLVQRLGRADAARHGSLAEYLDEVVGTRDRLRTLGVEVGDAFAKWILMAGLRTYEGGAWHAQLLREQHPETLEWSELVAMVATRARRDAVLPRTGKGKGGDPEAPDRRPQSGSAKADPQTQLQVDDPTVLDCSVCGHEHESTWAWCKGCKKHHSLYWKCAGQQEEEDDDDDGEERDGEEGSVFGS